MNGIVRRPKTALLVVNGSHFRNDSNAGGYFRIEHDHIVKGNYALY